MNLDHLNAFAQVARLGSFAAAARTLDVDPSSISRAIAVLETDLGVRLLQRSTRRMELTQAGLRYRARIEPVLEELAQAGEEASSFGAEPKGLLKISASVAFGQRRLTPFLAEIRKAYPALAVELLLTDDRVDLIAEGVDLAIRLGPVADADMIVSKLMPTRYRVVASRSWCKANPGLATPASLSGVPCLRFNLPDFRTQWLFRAPDKTVLTVPVSGDIVISSALALREAALAGLGPALLADWLIGDDLKAGRLVDLFPHHQATATDFDTAAWLVYPSRTFLPRKVRVAIDILKNTVRAHS